MIRPARRSPAELVHELAGAMNEADLDRAMALFGPDPFVRMIPPPPDGRDYFSGREEVRDILAEFMAAHFRMELEVLEADEERVTTRTTTWHDFTRDLGVAPLTGEETYEVEDGLIRGFTYRFSDEDLARIGAALEGGVSPGA